MKSILILSANPKNTDKLRLDEEVREIQIGLERAKKRDEFEIVTRFALRVSDLRRALLDYEPQIVHFSGHGGGEDGLAVENDVGQMQLVSTESLANLFRLFQHKIECVVLNACYSETQAEAIYQHIDCVVGMNKIIGDRAAIEFAIGFYDALGAGRSYQEAYEFGCSAINLNNIAESLTPILKLRTRAIADSSPMISPHPTKPAIPPQEKPSQVLSIQGATVSGQVAQAGGNVNQTQHIHQGSSERQLTVTEVVELMAQIEPLIKIAALRDDQKNKAKTHLEVAKESVQEEEPDKDYAAKSLQKAIKILQATNEGVEASQGLWHQVKPILQQLLPWLGVSSNFFGF